MKTRKNKSNLISTFDVEQTQTEQVCLIDPMILTCIIILICLTLYIFEYKLSKEDIK